jgi:hypothetical protein
VGEGVRRGRGGDDPGEAAVPVRVAGENAEVGCIPGPLAVTGPGHDFGILAEREDRGDDLVQGGFTGVIRTGVGDEAGDVGVLLDLRGDGPEIVVVQIGQWQGRGWRPG